METGECLGISLVILDKPSEPGGPREGSFDDPSTRQENEPTLGLRQFDDFELDAVPGRRLLSTFTGIALVDPGDLDAVVGDGLNGLGELLASPRS